MRWRRRRTRGTRPTPSAQRVRRGLPGYLILFAPHAFAPQRQLRPRDPPSPPAFLLISAHFTATPGIPVPPTRSRSSASVTAQSPAFATGVPPDICAFHRYTRNSSLPYRTLVCPYPLQAQG